MGSVRLASVDVDLQLAVDLTQFSDGISGHELADILGVTAEDILAAFALGPNTGVCGEFYESVRAAFGEKVTYDYNGQEQTLSLPPGKDIAQDLEIVKIREIEFFTGTDFGTWPLPRSQLIVPWNDESLDELATQLERVGAHGRSVKVYDSSDHSTTLFQLEALIRKLQSEVEKANTRTAAHGGIIAAIEKARSVTMLQERHWWSEGRKGRVQDSDVEAHENRLGAIDARLLELGRMLTTELRHPLQMRKDAEKLMKMLSASDRPGGGVPGFLDTFEVARWNISAQHRDRFLKAISSACVLLSHSHLAAEFMKQHGLDIIEGFCADDGKHFQQVLNFLESEALIKRLDVGWQDTLDDLRKSLGAKPFGSSRLGQVAKIAKYTKTAIGLSRLILSPATFGRLLSGLRVLGRSANEDTQRLAALCTRLLVAPPLPWLPGISRAKSLEDVQFAATVTKAEEEFMLLRALDGAEMFSGRDQRAYWKQQGEEFTTFRMNERVFKRPGASALTLSVNLILLAATIASDEDDPYIHTFSLLGGILGTAQSASGLAAYFVEPRSRFFGSTTMNHVEASAKLMGRVAGIAGLLASVATLSKHAPTESTAVVINDSISVASGALGAVAWLAEGAGLLSVATGLGTAAAVLGIVALAGAALIDVLTPGPQSVLDAYVDFVENDEVGALFPIEIEAVRAAARVARDNGTFSDFRTINGRPRIDPYRTSPTLFGTMQLGFNHLEIEKLFACDSAYVAAVLPAEEDLEKGN